MPIMHVYFPDGALKDQQKSNLAGALTEIMLNMEGGARTRGGQAFALVLFSEIGGAGWWTGGHSDETFVSPPGAFLVRVTVPEGYLNIVNKSGVHAAVNAAILSVAGDTDAPGKGANIQVIIDEVTEGNWGAGGATISLAAIAETVGLPKDGSRFAWTRTYFEAKARLRHAFGFPADVGGLLPLDPKVAAKATRQSSAVSPDVTRR